MNALLNSKNNLVIRGKTAFLLLLLVSTIISGCVPVISLENSLPEDCQKQLALNLHKDSHYMAWVFYSVTLQRLVSTSPFITHFPFDEINAKITTNYRVGVGSVIFGIEVFRDAEMIVLLDESGKLVAIGLEKNRLDGIYDLKFYESALSSKWKDEILKMHEEGAMVMQADSWFATPHQQLLFFENLKVDLLDDKYDKDSFVQFMAKVKTVEEHKAWSKYWHPRNRFANSSDFKQLQDNSPTKQLLICKEEVCLDKFNYYELRTIINDTILLPGSTLGDRHKILKLLSIEKYSAIIYLPLHDEYDDPERTYMAQELRKIAAKKHLPYFVASPKEYEDNDITIPGIPPNIRIYKE